MSNRGSGYSAARRLSAYRGDYGNRGSYNRGGNYSGRYGYNNYGRNRGYSSFWYPYWGGRYGYRYGYNPYRYGLYGGLGYGLLGGYGLYGGYGGYGYGFGNGYYGNGFYGGYGTTNNYYTTQPTTVIENTTPADTQVSVEASASADAYYGAAYDAFREGRYDDALRSASHAAVEAPDHPQIHELISLALFAKGEYGPASMEAHAALANGEVSDWPTLYAHYGDVSTYTAQLKKLTDYQKSNPKSPEASFLLGYHNLMMGHKEAARGHLEKVLAQFPQDQVARDLLTQAGGDPGPAPTPEQAPAAQAPGVQVPTDATAPADNTAVPAEPLAEPN